MFCQESRCNCHWLSSPEKKYGRLKSGTEAIQQFLGRFDATFPDEHIVRVLDQAG
jgi:hypothetical protein